MSPQITFHVGQGRREQHLTFYPDLFLPNGIAIKVYRWMDPDAREILSLVLDSNPELDLRVVFKEDADQRPLYTGSRTSQAQW